MNDLVGETLARSQTDYLCHGRPGPRGEVYSAVLDPRRGSEQPICVVMVSRDGLNRCRAVVLLVPSTTALKKPYPSHGTTPKGVGHLAQNSTALCEHLRAMGNGQR